MALPRGARRDVARFATTDPRLHNWTVADPKFLGCGPGLYPIFTSQHSSTSVYQIC
jgi:hypothetical protein